MRAARSTVPPPKSCRSFAARAAIAAVPFRGSRWSGASARPSPAARLIRSRPGRSLIGCSRTPLPPVWARSLSIDSGSIEWPIATAGAVVGWQSSETGTVGAASAYATEIARAAPGPDARRADEADAQGLKQSGDALEQAVRRDMNAAMGEEMDRVVFLGIGSSGEPTGIVTLCRRLARAVQSRACGRSRVVVGLP